MDIHLVVGGAGRGRGGCGAGAIAIARPGIAMTFAGGWSRYGGAILKPCERYRVKGRVQGVFFRAATRDMARRLGLTGSVRNLPDGDVEVIACGARDKLDKLSAWLWQGPSSARVTEVISEPIEVQNRYDEFVVR